MSEVCPCGSELNYEKCCQPYHKKIALAPTAESLMRARYSAFAKGEIDYIINTFEPSLKKDQDRSEIETWANNSKWLSLLIKEVVAGRESETKGTVEFVANYIMNGKNCTHHELSTFKKIENIWYFCEGEVLHSAIKREGPKIGRNDPCPCGSGKKYKKCCIN